MSVLEGIRVLDLSRILAGPLATQTLADLGAEVIKIERPKHGDDTRGWGPPFVRDRNGEATRDSTYFLSCNRGKKSVTVDLSRPAGQALVRRLAGLSDVVIENFKVGDLARFGLDYAGLSAVNPRLVYCSITGYGQTGPYRNRPGYDPIAQAIGGLMSVTGAADGPPLRAGVAMIDVLTASQAVIAILAALRHRDATGEGQHIDLALLDVQVAAMINIAQAYLSAGVVGRRHGNEHPSVVPSQTFECADGTIMVSAANDGQFVRLCSALGLEALPGDARFARNADRVRNRGVLVELLAERFCREPVGYWMERLVPADVPCGPVNDIGQALQDPQVRARAMQIEMEHPAVGPIALIGSALHLSGSPVAYRRPPPTLGQHTAEVLGQLLGVGEGELAALAAQGIV